ncbi:ankyrin repeat protein [Rutstroemia sp. NJR-2017a BVV2]|nr:ankyrin repeat protein [Rutstroemia sp. NJR-2017a BVV2]
MSHRILGIRTAANMPSAKGKPTDPKLKEKITDEVKNQTNKDGSGQGKMAAWKANKVAKKYEEEGGDYENEAGSKDKPKKGLPEKKTEAEKSSELKEAAEEKKDAEETKEEAAAETNDKAQDETDEKADDEKKGRGRPKGAAAAGKKEPKAKKEPTQGTRVSARQRDQKAVGTEKRKNEAVVQDEAEEEEEKPAPKKKQKGKKVEEPKANEEEVDEPMADAPDVEPAKVEEAKEEEAKEDEPMADAPAAEEPEAEKPKEAESKPTKVVKGGPRKPAGGKKAKK